MTLFLLAFAMAFPAGAAIVRLLAGPDRATERRPPQGRF
jgi:hypothetical protein